MATKKPSLTKQISEQLGTEDKREQLKVIGNLVRQASAPAVAVTVLYAKGELDISVSSSENLGAHEVKAILSGAIDDITEQVVRARLEQENQDPEGPPGKKVGESMEDFNERNTDDDGRPLNLDENIYPLPPE